MPASEDSCVVYYVTLGVVCTTVVLLYLRRSRKSPRNEESNPPDTVILHQLGKGVHAPSTSPFALKLETYLRMANIPYKNQYDKRMSSKGKVPWIEFNNDIVPDSTFCIEYLNTKFDVNLDAKYSQSEKAIARAFVKMLEENTYWYVGLSRCVYDKNRTIFRKLGLNWLIRKILERKAKTAAWSHGMGRHSQEQVEHIAMKDIEALSHFIEKYPNLKQYCITMKEKYWPDWNERVLESI